jgi:oligopeptide/dipeptide ABC transporter ATP-binding protein
MTREHPDWSESTPAAELVRVENLRVHFNLYDGPLRRRELGLIRAVDGVSFTLRQGEALAVVGAPGCGKSTLARALALLDPPTAGRILFQGQDVTALRGRRLKRVRRHIQFLFSDPYIAFAPRHAVQQVIAEGLDGRQQDQRLAELMAQVGLNLYLAVRYPRELSGGNRQRVALARALAALSSGQEPIPSPSLLICDQPTEHLERAMGGIITDLLHELRQRLGLTVLLTARQLETARHAERVAVMLMGRIVEMGYYDDLIRQPLHPFAQALLQPHSDDFVVVVSRSLDPLRPAGGCPYAPVCPLAKARCRTSFPAFIEGAPHHGVACHLVEPL